MVTGEPGSGKTTLGTALGLALRVPFLSRDHVRGGLLATAGLWTNDLEAPAPREAAVDVLVDIVEHVAARGVSLVIEFIVTPDREAAFRRMTAAAATLVIITSADGSAGRAAARDRADPLIVRPEVLDALGYSSIDDYVNGPERQQIRTQMRLDFDLPVLPVRTDDGYDPSIGAILDWIIEHTRGTRTG